MSQRLFLKPAPGKVVRKPVGGHLSEKGEWITQESYWLRRLNDEDVEEAEAPPEPSEGVAADTPVEADASVEVAEAVAPVAAKPRGSKSR